MRGAKWLLVLSLVACSKKKEPPVAAQPVAPSATPSASASVEKAVEAPPPDAAVVDDAVEAEFVPREDLSLPEGAVVNLGKLTPATKDAVVAHAAALQTEFENQVKGGCKELGRFNASFVPATYVTCRHAGREGKNGGPDVPDEYRMIEVQGTSVVVKVLATGEQPNLFELWSTPRGYFLDLGDHRFSYILRREKQDDTHAYECIAKAWDPTTGDVDDKATPDYPTRGKDLDGDGDPEFPTAVFSYALERVVQTTRPKADTLCNIPRDDHMTIDVIGAVGFESRSFYEHRLKDARGRTARIAKQAGKTRKKGALRFTDACAVDAAQNAAEIYAYQTMLGLPHDQALAEADAVMKDRTLKPSECGGLTGKGGNVTDDQWSAMREALIAWKAPVVQAADAGVGAAKADAAHD